MMTRAVWAICLLVSSTGCGEVLLPDAGPADAGSNVADAADAGVPADTGVVLDSGVPLDTGVIVDTGVPADTGVPGDTGVLADTGVPGDTGVPADTGVHEDAGAPDAQPDAGPQMITVSLHFVGDGGGTVRWPDNTVCNADCTRQYVAGSSVDLVATADMSAVFSGWTGSMNCGAATTCTVQPSMDLSLDVGFDALHTVSVVPLGDGLGRVDGLNALCAPACSETHATGTNLALTAVPAAGVRFTGWSGACSGAQTTCNLSVTGPTTVQPNWQVITPQISQSPGGHFCALLGPRSVRCWGNGGIGQLGRGNTNNIGDDETVASQGDLPLGLDIVQVEAGGTHSCVLTKQGAVRCWGLNGEGQLGRGDTTSVGDGMGPAPANARDVALGGVAMQIVMGAWHSCALMAHGTVRCWGRGVEGQLGYGSPFNVGDSAQSTPALAGDVPLGAAAVRIAAGNAHTCAVLDSGALKCWGDNGSGQLGYPFSQNVGDGNSAWPTPAAAPSLPLGAGSIADVRAGVAHTCVRYTSGTVQCWGANGSGELGDGSNLAIGGPQGRTLSAGVGLVDLNGVAAVSLGVGATHSCAVLSTGAVRCWGQGMHGRTGYESTSDRNLPGPAVLLPAQHRPVDLGMIGVATCAVSLLGPAFTTHRFACWGLGASGALGTGLSVTVGDRMGTMPPIETSVN